MQDTTSSATSRLDRPGLSRRILAGLLLAALSTAALTPPARAADAPAPAATATPAPVAISRVRPRVVVVPGGTLILAHLDQPLSSQTDRTNDTFSFTVAEPVVVKGMLIVAAGARGQGHVADAEAARFLGRSGMLELAYDWVVAVDGEKLHVAGFAGSVGGGNLDTSLAAGGAASVASAVVPFAGFAALAVRGKKAEVGTGDLLQMAVQGTVHVTSGQAVQFHDGFAH